MSRDNTVKLTGRLATSMFLEVKFVFLQRESGGFKESNITASVLCWKGLSDGKVKQ